MGRISIALRNPASKITASALACVTTIVIEWFRASDGIDNPLVNADGLDEIQRHARRQEHEVKQHEMDHGQQTRHAFPS